MISEDEVKKIARLAYLNVEDSEVKKLASQLNAIFGYIQKLEKLDVHDVAPMSHVHGAINVFREDAVEPSLPVEDALKIAPDSSGRFIRVPIIIEQSE